MNSQGVEIFADWNIDEQMIILLNWSPFLKLLYNNFLMIGEHRSLMKSLSLMSNKLSKAERIPVITLRILL